MVAGRNTAQIKLLNTEMVRDCVKSFPDISNAEVARETGLSISTCSNILTELLDSDEVLISDNIESSGGRPARRYYYNDAYEYKLCIYAHTSDRVDSLFYAVCNAMGKIVESKLIEKTDINTQVFIDLIEKLINKYPKITVIGIGFPGIVSNGVIIASDIEELNGVELEKIIRERFDVFAMIGNDLNYKAYGCYKNMEWDEETSLAYLSFPGEECPGCGIVVDGKVLGGVAGFAGEVQYLLSMDLGLPAGEKVRLTRQDNVIEIASRLLCGIASIVNPKNVVITGSLIQKEDIDKIYEHTLKYIPDACLPKLIYRDKDAKDYIRGLVELTSALRLEENLAN